MDSQPLGVDDRTGHYRVRSTRALADLAQIKVITVDLDDTLWDVQPIIEATDRALHAYLSRHYPRMTADLPLSAMAELRRQVAVTYPHMQHDLTFLRKRMLRDRALVAQYGQNEANEIADEAFRVYHRVRNTIQPFDDVLPALEWLQERYRIISISNGNTDLHAIGIARFFDGCVWASEVGVMKPGVQMFLRPITHFQVNPRQCLHVGDDPVMDVAGARAVGYQTAWMDRFAVEWPRDQEPADFRLTSLAELVELLRPTASAPMLTAPGRRGRAM